MDKFLIKRSKPETVEAATAAGNTQATGQAGESAFINPSSHTVQLSSNDEDSSDDNSLSSSRSAVKVKGMSARNKFTKLRKHDDDYIKLGFMMAGSSGKPLPECVICSEVLANASLKPSKLKRHLFTKHPEFYGKPI